MTEEKTTLQETQAVVTRQFFANGRPSSSAEQKDENLSVRRFVTEPAKVAVEMSMTVNLGNFESARISVALTVPCYQEEHEEAYEYARKWVEKKTLAEASEARQFANRRSNF